MFDENKSKQELYDVMCRLFMQGFVSCVGGNASIILREGNFILVTPKLSVDLVR